MQILLQKSLQDGGIPTLRALTSEKYSRFWDSDVVQFAKDLTEGTGWQLPMGYALGKFGAPLVPSGAYAGDRDMFLFMIDPTRGIDLKGDQLFRGFFLWNSEVGAKSFGMMLFLYRLVCGNNIVWGAEGITELRKVHVGDGVHRAARQVRNILSSYRDSSAIGTEAKLLEAMNKNVAKNDDEAVKFLQDKDFTKTVAVGAVATARQEEGGAGTLWQLVQGVTGYARSEKYIDKRVELERKAGKLLSLVN
jgi:hypothetical protein